MNNAYIGIPKNESGKAVDFLKKEFRAAGKKKYAGIIGALERWEGEIGKFDKKNVESVGFNQTHLQTLKFILLGKLRGALDPAYYGDYLWQILPRLEDKAKKIAMSAWTQDVLFGHN